MQSPNSFKILEVHGDTVVALAEGQRVELTKQELLDNYWSEEEILQRTLAFVLGMIPCPDAEVPSKEVVVHHLLQRLLEMQEEEEVSA